MAHPEKTGKEIWYASLEGPEAGAYARGTAILQHGEVFVPILIRHTIDKFPAIGTEQVVIMVILFLCML